VQCNQVLVGSRSITCLALAVWPVLLPTRRISTRLGHGGWPPAGAMADLARLRGGGGSPSPSSSPLAAVQAAWTTEAQQQRRALPVPDRTPAVSRQGRGSRFQLSRIKGSRARVVSRQGQDTTAVVCTVCVRTVPV
jgi:hypothetical protein